MKKRVFGVRRTMFVFAAIGALASAAAYAGGSKESAEQPYEVNCSQETGVNAEACKVDKQTYIGWRTFHASCHQCHAQGAVGSSFAPSLVERLKGMSNETFEQRVLNGYQGQIGVMPAFKDNPNVVPRIDALFAYLKARSDGVLPPGKPDRK